MCIKFECVEILTHSLSGVCFALVCVFYSSKFPKKCKCYYYPTAANTVEITVQIYSDNCTVKNLFAILVQ